jgi:hypothetical protein
LKTKASLTPAALAISFVVVPLNPFAAKSEAAATMRLAWRSRAEARCVFLFVTRTVRFVIVSERSLTMTLARSPSKGQALGETTRGLFRAGLLG